MSIASCSYTYLWVPRDLATIIRNIIEMLVSLKDRPGSTTYVCLLYFERITDNRMSGRKLQGLNLFKAFAEHANIEYRTTVVTTMWNELCRDQQYRHAQERLRDLRIQSYIWGHLGTEHFFKEVMSTPSRTNIVRFLNNQQSGVEILKGVQGAIPDLSPHVPFQRKGRFRLYLLMNNLSRDIIRRRMCRKNHKKEVYQSIRISASVSTPSP
ncbi:hypothetical protein BJ165DRAFT_1409177 [Panaeolus papilionaceus]|nr:hypothetical protein BJ165DRAFT_1409177 [Panaeolus papilionaceus]